MICTRYEPFIGLHLFVFENRLRDRGVILECVTKPTGIMTFTTAGGDFSFYYNPFGIKLLKNGYHKLLGDKPRWAYVGPPWSERSTR